MFKRRLKLLGKILLGFIVLLAAFLLIERWRGQIALANLKEELIAKGEKLAPKDFNAPISPLENNSPALWAMIDRLQKGKLLPGIQPPLMRTLNSGRSIVGFREPYWIESSSFRDGKRVEGKVTNRWEQIAADLTSNAPIFLEIQAAMEQSVFVNELDYAAGPKMRIPHLAKAKTLAQWLPGETALALREGRKSDALVALRCQIQIPQLMAEDKALISELVRCAAASIARTATWEALQFDDWRDEELAVIQKAWSDQHFANSMSASVERELGSMIIFYQQLRASNDETYKIFAMLNLFGSLFESLAGTEEAEPGSVSLWEKIPFLPEITEFWDRQIYCRVWRFAWSHQAEHRALTEVHGALTLMREGATEKSHRAIRPKFEARESASLSGYYDRVRFLIVGLMATYSKTALRPLRAETDRSLTLAAIALKRYALRHDKYPDQLDALVSEFLSAMPIDYMDGKPVKYRLNTDAGFTLYSVGEDGLDDGGDSSLPPEVKRSRDLWRRRDYVWPAPATAEEVEEYRRKAIEG